MGRVFTIAFLFFCTLLHGQVRYPTDTFQHRVNGINEYTPVSGFDACTNKLIVEEAFNFNVGDTVVIIQMKGAVIDSSNTAAFGTVTNYRNAGNYEFNYIKSISGDTVELKNNLVRHYDIPGGKVQLIRVPTYSSFNTPFLITCDPWNGSFGGVVVFIVKDTLTLNQDIDVSGYGFKGGINGTTVTNTTACNENRYYYDSSSWQAARKGEGIAETGTGKWNGRGALANGGGGGNGQNSGAGGGSNGSLGGLGGYQLDSCGNSPFDNRGIGGKVLVYNNNANKIFMGGGGGAGQNDGGDIFFKSDGGQGGGIIIVKARVLRTNNYSIKANGSAAANCLPCYNDGMGGGGAGGTILMEVGTYLDSVTISATGGVGVSVQNYANPKERVGPGGGGSGGVIWFYGNTPTLARINKKGGDNGVIVADANNPWGATAGTEGIVLNDLVIPYGTTPFKHNIDSVKIDDDTVSCTSYNFSGLAFVNTFPVTKWEWDFGDATTANVQNIFHDYAANGPFMVKLSVEDEYGCRDSTFVSVPSYFIQVDAGNDTTVCASSSVVLQGAAIGASQLTWSPAQWLNNNTLPDPLATPPAGTTKFYLTASNGQGCSKTDSVIITVRAAAAFSIAPSFSICENDSARLLAAGGDMYLWTPGNYTAPDPLVYPPLTTNYSVMITDTVCHNSTQLFTTITVNTLPGVRAGKSNDIDCSNDFSQLNATGALTYAWSPAATLNDAGIANPVARPIMQTQYTVKGTDNNGCINYDTVTVNISALNKAGYAMPSAFTPNDDGLNDCYGIRYWGTVQELDFSIYNRWGIKLFHTGKPGDCWDGSYKGVLQNADVYVYIIKAKTICGDVFRKGTFVLIR